ncbi:hypothetical protein CL653_02685 [bacterium]|nr:hypothetical protein [bacterium]|tara:strand:+ start:2223 stop:2837 length:615 start_codon:yes stop_codon:yes gene_type:complete
MKLTDLTKESVLEEVAKIQYLYKLKYEIRYDQNREDKDYTESVAEHIYGMHILATYFLPLENPKRDWNRQKIYEMITWHDMDEVETGDMIGYMKTPADRARETEAMKVVLQKSPAHLQDYMTILLGEYESLSSNEAKFVKALDRVEPLFHLYNEKGRNTMKMNRTTLENSEKLKQPYIQEFPFIKLFSHTLTAAMETRGYFYKK